MRLIFSIVWVLFSTSCFAQEKIFLLPFLQNGQWGYLNKVGEIIIPPKFDQAGQHKNGFATAKIDDLCYLIDSNGNFVFENGFHDIQRINNEYLALKKIDSFALADINGKLFTPFSYSIITSSNLNTMLLRIDSSFQLFNGYTKKVSEEKFLNVKTFTKEKYHESKKGNKVVLLDSMHQYIIPYTECEKAFLEQGIPIVKTENGNLIFNKKGGICGDSLKWKYYSIISKDFVSVWNTAPKKHLVSIHSGNIFPFMDYTLYEPLAPNLLIAVRKEKRGIINQDGKLILPIEYQTIHLNPDQTILIVKESKLGLLNPMGEILFQAQFETIEPFDSNDNAFALKNGYWGIINKNGKIIIPLQYDEIVDSEENYKCYKNKSMDLYTLNSSGKVDEMIHFNSVGTVSLYKKRERSFAFRNTIDAKKGSNNEKIVGAYELTSVFYNYQNNSRLKCLIDKNFQNVKKLYGVYHNEQKRHILQKQYWDISIEEFATQEYCRAILPGDKQVLIGKKGNTKNMFPAPKNGKVLPQQAVYIGPFTNGLARINIGGHFSKGNDITESGRATFSNHSLSCQGGYWGYINGNGEVAIPIDMEYVSDFKNGKAIVKIKGKYGIIDTLNSFIIKPSYDLISYLEKSDKNYFKLTNNKKECGILTNDGRIIKNAQYEAVGEWNENRISIRENGKWGCITYSGETIIDPKFDFLTIFHNGISAFQDKGKWGFIDSLGSILIPARYLSTQSFNEGLAAVKIQGRWGYIDKTGKTIIPAIYSRAGNFHLGIACVQYKSKWYFIDNTGKKFTKKGFRESSDFNEHGLAIVRSKNYYTLLKKLNGKLIPNVKYKSINNFSEGLSKVKDKKGKIGFIDSLGKLIIPCIYSNAGDFNEGLARVRTSNGKWGYINNMNILKIEPIYQKAEDFSEGKATVINTNNTIIIDYNGTPLITLKENILGKYTNGMLLLNGSYYNQQGKKEIGQYKSANPFANETAIVSIPFGNRLITKQNSTLAEYPFISPIKQSIGSFHIANRIGLADETGAVIIPVKYQNMTFIGDGIFQISHFDAIGYMHKSGKWIWKPTR